MAVDKFGRSLWRRAPCLTLIARVPVNGAETNQAFAKRVPGRGAYGRGWQGQGTRRLLICRVLRAGPLRPPPTHMKEPA